MDRTYKQVAIVGGILVVAAIYFGHRYQIVQDITLFALAVGVVINAFDVCRMSKRLAANEHSVRNLLDQWSKTLTTFNVESDGGNQNREDDDVSIQD